MQQNTEDQVPSVHSKKKWLLLTALGGGVLFAALLTVAGLLTHGAIKSDYQQSSVAVDAPVEVKLSQRLLQVPLDKIRSKRCIDV